MALNGVIALTATYFAKFGGFRADYVKQFTFAISSLNEFFVGITTIYSVGDLCHILVQNLHM